MSALANLESQVCELPTNRVVGFFGCSGRKKRTSFLSCLTSLNALEREPNFLGNAIQLVIEASQRRLLKISGRMYSLYFGASLAPRMLQAASHIQDSRDLSPLPLLLAMT